MRTILVHKNDIGCELARAIVDENIGVEQTLANLLGKEWILSIGDTIEITSDWVEE